MFSKKSSHYYCLHVIDKKTESWRSYTGHKGKNLVSNVGGLMPDPALFYTLKVQGKTEQIQIPIISWLKEHFMDKQNLKHTLSVLWNIYCDLSISIFPNKWFNLFYIIGIYRWMLTWRHCKWIPTLTMNNQSNWH